MCRNTSILTRTYKLYVEDGDEFITYLRRQGLLRSKSFRFGDAEDAIHEAYAALFKRPEGLPLETMDHEGQIISYIKKCVLNAAYKILRANQRHTSYVFAIKERDQSKNKGRNLRPVSIEERIERLNSLLEEELLGKLTERECRIWKGLYDREKIPDTAAAMGVKNKSLHTMRNRLKDKLVQLINLSDMINDEIVEAAH